jgi:hypothetical protein
MGELMEAFTIGLESPMQPAIQALIQQADAYSSSL